MRADKYCCQRVDQKQFTVDSHDNFVQGAHRELSAFRYIGAVQGGCIAGRKA